MLGKKIGLTLIMLARRVKSCVVSKKSMWFHTLCERKEVILQYNLSLINFYDMKFGKIAFIFTLSVITPVGLTASFVSEEFTCKIADNFFSQKGVAKGFISSTVNCQSGNRTVAYVHNFSQGGWVMVAADDAIEPIVAYNYDNTYALDTTDDIQASIFKGLSDRIEHLSKSSTRKSEKWSILSKKPYPR